MSIVNNRLIPVDLLSNLMPVPCIGNQIRTGFWYDSLSRLSREAGPKNRRHDALNRMLTVAHSEVSSSRLWLAAVCMLIIR